MDYDASDDYDESTEQEDYDTELYEEDDYDTELYDGEDESSEEDEDTELYSEEDEQTEDDSQTENSDKTDDEVRAEINEKSNYSDEVNDNIKSVDELEVYQKAGLKEEQVDGKTCLVRDDIDWEQKDEFGRTNRERAEKNLSPISKNGETVELHHIGQKDDSPLAELTMSEHRGKGNDSVLHDKTKDSEIDRPAFTTERINHWKARI